MLKKYFLITLLLLAGSTAFAQELKRCSHAEMWEEAIKNDPEAAVRNAELSRVLPPHLAQFAERTASGTILFTIPVVVHIIHTYGADNISKAQVLNAIEILNNTFQLNYADTANVIQLFRPILANCQTQFRLANFDPNGGCSEGITRTYSPLTNSANDAVKQLVQWNSTKYLNVWVVNNLASGAGGYSYLPGISASLDGIVVRNDQFGGIGTSGGSTLAKHTLTHEVGHWLNLMHTWGGSNTPGLANNCNIDDGIFDTPNTIGVMFGCDTNFNSCGDIANVQNFMDYASCEIMFTEGQKDAMHTTLYSTVNSRNNLWSPANLLATGTEDNHVTAICTPRADFDQKLNYICAGSAIAFKDASWNGDIISRTWIFNGGTPSTSTDSAVTVVYNTPGTYDVTLMVTSAGGSDTLIRVGNVNVLPAVSQNPIPYSESFETLVIQGSDWAIENPNNNSTWTINSLGAATGTNSIRIQNNTGSSAGSIDALITPAMNFSGVTGVVLNYKMAFAPKVSSDTSSFKIYVSTNCGRTWMVRSNRSGSQIHTAPNNFAGNFVPTAAQWRNETLVLTPYNNNPNVRFKFEFTNRNGNNFYLDDINFTGTVGLNGLNASLYQLELFPNPAGNQLNVKLQPEKSVDITIELTDLAGRVVYTHNAGRVPAGEFNYQLSNNGYNGMYILRVRAGNDQMQSPVIFNAQ